MPEVTASEARLPCIAMSLLPQRARVCYCNFWEHDATQVAVPASRGTRPSTVYKRLHCRVCVARSAESMLRTADTDSQSQLGRNI
jgi:hypothetical protein